MLADIAVPISSPREIKPQLKVVHSLSQHALAY